MAPIIILKRSSPICRKPPARNAVVWKITFIDSYNKGDHKPEEPWGVSGKKGRNRVIGFKRSIALMGSEQSKAVDERANVKSGLQSRTRVLFPWNPQSEDRCEMRPLEIPYLGSAFGLEIKAVSQGQRTEILPARKVRCCSLNLTISKSNLLDSLDNRKQDFPVRRELLWNVITAAWPGQEVVPISLGAGLIPICACEPHLMNTGQRFHLFSEILPFANVSFCYFYA